MMDEIRNMDEDSGCQPIIAFFNNNNVDPELFFNIFLKYHLSLSDEIVAKDTSALSYDDINDKLNTVAECINIDLMGDAPNARLMQIMQKITTDEYIERLTNKISESLKENDNTGTYASYKGRLQTLLEIIGITLFKQSEELLKTNDVKLVEANLVKIKNIKGFVDSLSVNEKDKRIYNVTVLKEIYEKDQALYSKMLDIIDRKLPIVPEIPTPSLPVASEAPSFMPPPPPKTESVPIDNNFVIKITLMRCNNGMSITDIEKINKFTSKEFVNIDNLTGETPVLQNHSTIKGDRTIKMNDFFTDAKEHRNILNLVLNISNEEVVIYNAINIENKHPKYDRFHSKMFEKLYRTHTGNINNDYCKDAFTLEKFSKLLVRNQSAFLKVIKLIIIAKEFVKIIFDENAERLDKQISKASEGNHLKNEDIINIMTTIIEKNSFLKDDFNLLGFFKDPIDKLLDHELSYNSIRELHSELKSKISDFIKTIIPKIRGGKKTKNNKKTNRRITKKK
jgi:hypothetical protein